MTASKSLPARPSLESLRKQAKRLARDSAAGDAAAIARARMQLPDVELPLTQRNAQLVIGREYGYAGWQDLTAEVSKRLGNSLEWAAAQARHVYQRWARSTPPPRVSSSEPWPGKQNATFDLVMRRLHSLSIPSRRSPR